MSKSLKNFVSIREYLDNGGGRGESMIDAAAETTTTSPASVTNPRRSTKAEAIAAADDLRVFCLQYHYRRYARVMYSLAQHSHLLCSGYDPN